MNRLYIGDNLQVLNILQHDYVGCVKMVYIDPPYNTKKKRHYHDNYGSHEQWVEFMHPRLELVRNLLTCDGSIFVSIDDNEQAYLRILCDEVFGGNNFIAQLIIKTHGCKNNSKHYSVNHEYCLVYARDKKILENEWSPTW